MAFGMRSPGAGKHVYFSLRFCSVATIISISYVFFGMLCTCSLHIMEFFGVCSSASLDVAATLASSVNGPTSSWLIGFG